MPLVERLRLQRQVWMRISRQSFIKVFIMSEARVRLAQLTLMQVYRLALGTR